MRLVRERWSFVVGLFALVAIGVFVDARLSMELIDFDAGRHDFRVPMLLDAYARYDTGWYISIADRGYFYAGVDQQSSVAFFPAYPAALRIVEAVVGSYVIAGVLVTLTCGLGVSALFYRWVEAFLGARVARLALVLLLCYPFAFYLFGVVYSDALFLVAVLGAFVLLERDRPLLAGFVGAVATAARPVGVALCVGLVLRLLEIRGVLPGSRAAAFVRGQVSSTSSSLVRLWPRRVDLSALKSLRVRDGGVVLSVLGLVAFMALLWVRFDEPLAFTKVGGAAGWWRGVGIEVLAKVHLFRLWQAYGLDIVTFWLVVQGLLGVVALTLVPAVVRRFGWGYGAYVLLAVGIAFATTRDFIGMGRYVLAAFPAFAAAADLLAGWAAAARDGPGGRPRRLVPAAVVVVQVVLLGWMTSLFARWYFLS